MVRFSWRVVLRRSYFRSIAYEWRLLVEWLETDVKGDAVVFILGDHQPALEPDVPGARTRNTPLHVLSRSAELVESFRDAGFQQGLYAAPGVTPALRHEGLLSLWISKLMAAHGTRESPPVRHLPAGIGLAGLRP